MLGVEGFKAWHLGRADFGVLRFFFYVCGVFEPVFGVLDRENSKMGTVEAEQ